METTSDVRAPNTPIEITKWKVKKGFKVSHGAVLFIYNTENAKGLKMKSNEVGTVADIIAKEGEVILAGSLVLTIQSCSHPTVMKDMCADCGADLRNELGLAGDRKEPVSASVAMIHSIPELIVSEEQAMELGKADEQRLLKTKKLVLLVDLDQTLIHTTNDNIPANLKGVDHFQLPHGHSRQWYHTRLRPGTQSFLESISKMYEMHICTFGVRMYAHTIAGYLDPEGKYFSHRILSRDEFFNQSSKTANLKALFPCGDAMVCIIDDREDVWNFSPNLIHVKPYRFFQGTADINAPPGLAKNEKDGEPVNHKVRRVSKSLEGSSSEGAKKDTDLPMTSSPEASSQKTSQETTSKENTTLEITAQEQISQENTTSDQNTSQETSSQENASQENMSKENTSKENASQENTSKENASIENTSKENISKENTSLDTSLENTSKENTSLENTSKENASKENTSKENTSKENTSKENTSLENTSKENASKENTSKENISKENASKENTSKENASKENISKENASKENTSKENTSQDNTSKENTSQENTSPEISSQENTAKENTSRENTSQTTSFEKEESTTQSKTISEGLESLKKVSSDNSDVETAGDTVQSESYSVKNSSQSKEILQTSSQSTDDTVSHIQNKPEDLKNSNMTEVQKEESGCIEPMEIGDGAGSNDKTREVDIGNHEGKEDSEKPGDGDSKTDDKTDVIEEIEWDDEDDYLLYLEDILTRIHKAFYDFHDQLKNKTDADGKECPDLKKIIPYVKRKVLKGTNLVFSGVFPTNIQPEKSRAYIVAKNLGANIQLNVIPKVNNNPDATTHVVAALPGTQKVRTAQRLKGIKIVTPTWLWCCYERFEHVDERLYALAPNTNNSEKRDSPVTVLQQNSRSGKRKAAEISNSETEDITANAGKKIKNESSVSEESSADKKQVFSSSYNPLYAFSDEDIAFMDKEVEDLMEEDGDESEEDDIDRDSRLRGHVLSTSNESSSDDSLSGEFPRGWKVKCRKSPGSKSNESSPERKQKDEAGDEESDNDLDKYLHTVEAFAPDTGSDDNESIGSVDDEMAEAVEKEFLSQFQ